MKKKPFFYYTFFPLLLMSAFSLSAFGQQQFTQVASRANSYCNSTCTLLDNPDLNKNPNALVMATPVTENGSNLNPHPIGVHFINEKWSIINLDQSAMPAGSKFNVQYFSTPDPAYQFVHTVNKENLKDNNTRSYIDHAGLNNNPEAQVKFIVNGIKAGYNLTQINIQYDNGAGQWYFFNTGNKPLDNNISINIVTGEKQATTSPAIAIIELTTTAQPTGTTPAITFSGNIQEIWMSVEGAQQGKFKGETTITNRLGKIQLTGFNFETAVPVEISSGLSTGKHINQPISVTKSFGPASLQCYKAFLTNESLKTITIEFYALDRSSQLQLVNTIKLTNARLIGFKQNRNAADEFINPKGFRLLEEIKFTYQKIEMTDAAGFTISD